jgi:hypothetical protein
MQVPELVADLSIVVVVVPIAISPLRYRVRKLAEAQFISRPVATNL